MDMDTPAQTGPLVEYLRSLQPQRLIIRGINELRPSTTGRLVEVGRVCRTEVITVVNRERVARAFDGVTRAVAVREAKGAGHDVIEQDGNLT